METKVKRSVGEDPSGNSDLLSNEISASVNIVHVQSDDEESNGREQRRKHVRENSVLLTNKNLGGTETSKEGKKR